MSKRKNNEMRRSIRTGAGPSAALDPARSSGRAGLALKTQVRAGRIAWNHNQKNGRAGLALKTRVRAGRIAWNHSQTVR